MMSKKHSGLGGSVSGTPGKIRTVCATRRFGKSRIERFDPHGCAGLYLLLGDIRGRLLDSWYHCSRPCMPIPDITCFLLLW